MNLSPFLAALATQVPLADTTRTLFGQLGYPTDRQNALEEPTWTEFEANYVEGKPRAAGFDQVKARVSEWAEVDLAFQLAQADLTDALTKDRNQLGIMFEEKRSVDVRNVQAWLLFSVRLTGTAYSRAELAALTRELNRLFNGPALVLMTYGPDTGKQAALAVIHRRLNKQDGSRDVLEKVSLLKDINLANPNRAHLDILEDLGLAKLKSQHPSLQTFADLYRAWHQTLDTQALNNRFYRELRNWYFWAVEKVEFPSDAEPDRATRNATGVIRLITRLMFCWFLKEKGLISAEVFNEDVFRALVDPARDTTGSAYYRAILQNLFFATLNTEMEKDFVAPADKPEEKSRLFKPATVRNIDPNRGDKTYYRYANLFRDFDKVTGDAPAGVGLFRDIPHLNGGLFECLDERSGGAGAKNSISRAIDCFTAEKKHYGHLSVPNELFFGEPHVEDLSANYDDKEKKKHRRDAVRGLIPLLNRYKFTVEENTPLEEEVALDPELLGRVFESLLATYNPETRQTARKQTGSFYTPREIVAYMVDESLLHYLAEKLEPTPPPKSNGRPGTNGTGPKLVQTQDRLAENLFKETKPQQASLSMVPAARTVVAEVPEVVDEPTKETATVTRLRSLLGHAPLVAAPHPEHVPNTVGAEEPLFSAEETRTLVRALAQARILDPACGSGAYPMGTLQQLTNVLSRLDPYNHYWREALAEQVQLRVRGTFRIEDPQERARQLADLNAVFEQHTGTDYGRKLYLIQQAMYGVDLQPIAVQIAKLRFFISLVVEQVPDDTRPNRGIRALPNLETKFVAANSLMRLARPKQLVIQNPVIEPLKAQLLETRRKHFLARGNDKRKLRAEDQRLRTEISKLLKKDGWNATEADQVAGWNPYDQNAHADFFDPEWMFGIDADQGFDVVIGNPPYVQLQKIKDVSRQLSQQGYSTFAATSDLYVLFYERGMQLLRKGGLLCYITSNKWMKSGYGSSLRDYFYRHTNPLHLLDFASVQIFDSATVDTNILLVQKGANQQQAQACVVGADFSSLGNLSVYFQHRARPARFASDGQAWVVLNEIEGRIKDKIEAAGIPLKDWNVQINYGIKTGFNEAFIIDASMKDRLLRESPKSAEIIRPILRGRDIDSYYLTYPKLWLLFIPWHFPVKPPFVKEDVGKAEERFVEFYPELYNHLTRFREELSARNPSETGIRYEWYALQRYGANYAHLFDQEKIVWGNLNDKAKFSLDSEKACILAPCNMLSTDNENIYYLLAVLNSKVTTYFMRQQGYAREGGYVEYKKQFLEQLPIPNLNQNLLAEIEHLVRKAVANKKNGLDISELENKINTQVFKAYNFTEKEIEYLKNHGL